MSVSRPHQAACARSALLDHQALNGAAEIAALIGEPRHGQPRTVRTDPGFGIEQDPVAGRLARKIHGEIGVEKGPGVKIQHGRSAVAEIRRRHRPHRLRNVRAFHDRPVDAVPDRARPGTPKWPRAARSDIPVTKGLEEKSTRSMRDRSGPGSSTGSITASGGSSLACTLIFSTVAPTTTTPFARSLTAQSWILRPSRNTSLSI